MLKQYTDQDYYENDYITTPQIDSFSELFIGATLVVVVLTVTCLWV